ncbi:hypothetical protein HHI36_011217 [Cryptolaemus montrouzieri]|uniref:Lipase domain-containing protein n=1 Tax=Cryptolaemus montrouzieri TaxID=559131 RepID=A0ABD2ML56_9CUCU
MRNIFYIFLTFVAVTRIRADLNKNETEQISMFEGETYWLVRHAYQWPVQLTTLDSNTIDPATEKVVFLMHGWLDSRESGWYTTLTNSILEKYPTWNVIQVDWSTAASSLNYYIAAGNVMFVGQNVGTFINNIFNTAIILQLTKFYLLAIRLDPAFPPWNFNPCDLRLCESDAQYLTVIHTDVGTNGIIIPIGNADFYPNDGTNQPGCELYPSISHTCNHMRAISLFIEGIQYPDHFTSTKCANYETYITNPSLCDGLTVHMADLFTEVEGIFYLRTNAQPPYSIN